MRTILKLMLNLIVPPRCRISGDLVGEPGHLSPDIWNKIHFITDPYCQTCGVPFSADLGADENMLCASCLSAPPDYDHARAGVVYDDLTRQLILRYKHGDHLYLVRSFLPWIENSGADLIDHADIIVPVPLHWTRMLKRRYNQAAILAAALAKKHDKDYAPFAMKRIKATAPQGQRKAKQRKENVRGAFAIPAKADLKGKAVLLVDDVMTSGASAVYILAVARAVKT